MTLKISIVDAISGEEIIRDMTDEEYKAELDRRKSNDLIESQAKAEAKEKEDAKAVLLERLGINEDEAKLLLA